MGAVFKAGIFFFCFVGAVATASSLPSACRNVAVPEMEKPLDHLLSPGLAEQIAKIRQEIAWNLATDPHARETLTSMKDESHPLWKRVFSNLETPIPQLLRLIPQLRIELGLDDFPDEREFLAGRATASMYFKPDGTDIVIQGRTSVGNEQEAREMLNAVTEKLQFAVRVKSFSLLRRRYPTFAPEQQVWEARIERLQEQ